MVPASALRTTQEPGGLTRNAVPSSMIVGSWERQMSTARSQACLGGEQRSAHWASMTCSAGVGDFQQSRAEQRPQPLLEGTRGEGTRGREHAATILFVMPFLFQVKWGASMGKHGDPSHLPKQCVPSCGHIQHGGLPTPRERL